MERCSKQPVKYEEFERGQVYESFGFFDEAGQFMKTFELFLAHVSTVVLEAELLKSSLTRQQQKMPMLEYVSKYDNRKFKTDKWHVNAFPIEQAGLWLNVSHLFEDEREPSVSRLQQSLDSSSFSWCTVVPYTARKFFHCSTSLEKVKVKVKDELTFDIKREMRQMYDERLVEDSMKYPIRRLEDEDFYSAKFFSQPSSLINMTLYGLTLDIDRLYEPWNDKILVRPSPILFTSIGTPVTDATSTHKRKKPRKAD